MQLVLGIAVACCALQVYYLPPEAPPAKPEAPSAKPSKLATAGQEEESVLPRRLSVTRKEAESV